MLSARIRRVHFSWGYCSVLAGCNGSSQAGSVVISRNGVLMRSETQAHPYQGWTTFVVLQAFSCKVPVVQSIFCLNNPVWRNPILYLGWVFFVPGMVLFLPIGSFFPDWFFLFLDLVFCSWIWVSGFQWFFFVPLPVLFLPAVSSLLKAIRLGGEIS